MVIIIVIIIIVIIIIVIIKIGNPMNPVPEDYRVPEGSNAMSWFYLYFFGDRNKRIRPFYMIKNKSIPSTKEHHIMSKGRTVMKYLCSIILENFGHHGEHITPEVLAINRKLLNSLVEPTVEGIEIKMRHVLLRSEVPVLFDAVFKDLASRVSDISSTDRITTISRKLNQMLQIIDGSRRKRHRDNNNMQAIDE